MTHPPGTQAEIQEAVEGAIRDGQFKLNPSDGTIRGTTRIQGVQVGFQGKIIGRTVRVSSVFAKQ